MLDSQAELSENVYGPIHTVKLAVADPSNPLGVAGVVKGVYHGQVDEFKAIK